MLGCSRNTRKDIEIMGQIKVQKNVGGIEGLCIIEPTVHGDNRGYFMETYNSKDMQEAGIDRVFVQDNQSCSTKECSADFISRRNTHRQSLCVQ